MTALKILVVEDDPSIVMIVETILNADGHTIETYDTGDAARTAGEADVVLADLTLPGGTGGVALTHALRARMPHLGVVYMSGAIDDAAPPGAVTGAALLGKPFRRQALRDAITRAIAERP